MLRLRVVVLARPAAEAVVPVAPRDWVAVQVANLAAVKLVAVVLVVAGGHVREDLLHPLRPVAVDVSLADVCTADGQPRECRNGAKQAECGVARGGRVSPSVVQIQSAQGLLVRPKYCARLLASILLDIV